MSFKMNVRKALENPLRTALAAASPAVPVILPNFSDDASNLDEYVRLTIHHGRRIVREIGPTPRQEASGFALCGIFTRIGGSADRNDAIAGIVEAAYPYDLNLAFGGVTVNIGTVDVGDGVLAPAGRYYSPVQVNWTVWRIQ